MNYLNESVDITIYNEENNEEEILSVKQYLNNDYIDAIKVVHYLEFSNIKQVTTIENLTTFYDYKGSGLIIYLGGFAT